MFHRSYIRTIQDDILSNGNYEEYPMREAQWDMVEPPMKAAIRAIAAADKRVNDRDLHGSLFSRARWMSVLKHTVKTHKLLGFVDGSPIHATTGYAFASISRWAVG